MRTSLTARNGSILIASACLGVIARPTPAAVISWDGGTLGTGSVYASPTNWAGDVLPADGDSILVASATVSASNPNGIVAGTTTTTTLSTGREQYLNQSLTGAGGGTPFTGTPPGKSFQSITYGTDDPSTNRLPAGLTVFNGFNSTYAVNNVVRLTGDANGNVLNLAAGAAANSVSLASGSYGTTTYQLAGATPATNTINVAAVGSAFFISAVVDGSAGLTKAGAGVTYLNNAANTVGGDFFINGGVLGVSTGGGLGTSTNTVHIADGAALALDNVGTVSGTVAASHTIELNGASRLQVGTSESWQVNGAIVGNGSLNKTGAGAANLNGPLSYTGSTLVTNGSLYVNSTLNSATPVVNNTGTTLGGLGTINGNVNVGGTLLPGSSGSIGTLTVNGNVTLNNGTNTGIFRSNLSTTDALADVLNVSGLFDFAEGGSLALGNLNARGEPVIVIAKYGSIASGSAFASVTGLLGDYTLDYNYGGLKQIALVRNNTKLYYTGTTSGDFATANNFTIDAANTTSTAQYATASADVTIDTGKPLTTAAATVAATTYVNSLTFTDSGGVGPNGFSISQATAGTGSLVIKAAGINFAAGTGIQMTGARAVTNTIATPVTVANSQNWTNDSAGILVVSGTVALGSTTLTLGGTGSTTVSGVVSGSGALTATGTGTVRLSGANTYLGVTTVSKTPNGGALVLASAAQAAVLTTGAGADIRSGGVIFEYSDASLVTTIRGLLAASFADPATPGVMDSGKLRSSTATDKRGLGYADLGGGQVQVKATLFGDADLDGGVSINDFNALAGNFGQATGRVWTQGDFDYDGGVSINDFNLLAGNFGQTLPASSEAWAGLLAFAAAHNDLEAFTAITGVPEPTSLGLIAAGATLGLRRRRRA